MEDKNIEKDNFIEWFIEWNKIRAQYPTRLDFAKYEKIEENNEFIVVLRPDWVAYKKIHDRVNAGFNYHFPKCLINERLSSYTIFNLKPVLNTLYQICGLINLTGIAYLIYFNLVISEYQNYIRNQETIFSFPGSKDMLHYVKYLYEVNNYAVKNIPLLTMDRIVATWNRYYHLFDMLNFKTINRWVNYLTIPPTFENLNYKNNEIDSKLQLLILPFWDELSDRPASLIKEQLHESEYYIKKQNYTWKILFNGKEILPVKDCKAIKYIRILLKNPGKSFHVRDLCRIVNGIQSDEQNNKMINGESLGIDKLKDYDILTDQKTMDQIQQRLKKLNDMRSEALECKNYDEIEKIDKETKSIGRYLSGKKVKGKLIKLNPQTKKDYEVVKKNYDRFLNMIRKEKNDEFYIHLKNSIHIHIYCDYTPDRDIVWET